MNPRVKDVKPNSDYTLTITFANGEIKSFDVKPYLNIGIFKELKDKSQFNSVKPFWGSIQWKNGQDFCPDTLYLESVAVEDAAILQNFETAAEPIYVEKITA
jgi:hypothetical protein